MTKICDTVMDEGKVLRNGELSTLIPRGEVVHWSVECDFYWLIKLLEHEIKVLERVLERRLR